jgi:hypothetical protein
MSGDLPTDDAFTEPLNDGEGPISARFVLTCESCGMETPFAPHQVTEELRRWRCGVVRELVDADEIRERLQALDETDDEAPADARSAAPPFRSTSTASTWCRASRLGAAGSAGPTSRAGERRGGRTRGSARRLAARTPTGSGASPTLRDAGAERASSLGSQTAGGGSSLRRAGRLVGNGTLQLGGGHHRRGRRLSI